MTSSEDAIASLMNQMREEQGYNESTIPKDDEKKQKSKKTSVLQELEGYPDNTRVMGSESIWNPYVQAQDPPTALVDSMTVATNPQVEMIRRRAFEKFKQACQEVLQQFQQTWKLKLPIPSMLEKWHMDAKLVERRLWIKKRSANHSSELLASTGEIYQLTLQEMSTASYYDPILLGKQASPLFTPTLEAEVKRAWSTSKSKNPQHDLPPRFPKKAKQVQKALHRCICECLETYQQQLQQATRNESSKRLPKIRTEEMDQISITYSGISLRVHSAYWSKLQRLSSRTSMDCTLEEAVFCLLCRYDMLQGAGLQAGVPGAVMDVLLQQLDCHMECFASPLNCRYENFASAFDLDRPFGSLGSFFDLDFDNGGSFQANPPFCEGLIADMKRTMVKALKNTKAPLQFIIFVPAWKDSQAYQALLQDSDEWLTHHMLLSQGKHWYAEGTQHRRKRSFRVASFDTSIFFFQNSAAKLKWNVTEESLLQDLRQAFCDDPGAMEKTSGTSTPPKQTAKVQPKSLSAPVSEPQVTTKPSKAKPRQGCKARKNNRGKKRQFTTQEDEHASDMGLLQSLGLSSSTGDEDTTKKTTVRPDKGSKARKKRRN